MCGIAGEINLKSKTDPSVFNSMRDSLKKRGPDQDGIYRDREATLIHTRLSVIDPLNGIQPMKTRYGTRGYCVTYNGELYNTAEIKKELLDLGHHFETRSDTEVLLKAYVEWKEKCVDHFNGIFAFAIWDEEEHSLFIARDKMGVKPFFYYESDGLFVFASEIKALLLHPMIPANIDEQSAMELILLGPGRTPGCGVFCGVKELCPGYRGRYQEGRLTVTPYWQLSPEPHVDSLEDTIAKVRFLVTDAIHRQLVSDVPLCTFLSGGLDSSIISALAARNAKTPLHTFSIDYLDNEKYFQSSKFQPDRDEEYIKIMSNSIGSIHHNIVIDTPELVDALFEAVEARDLPGMADVDASLLLFCKKVKEVATVSLSGECADEIFGGYPWYRDETVRNRQGFPWSQSTSYRASFLRDEFLTHQNAEEYVFSRYAKTIAKVPENLPLSPLEKRMKEMTLLNLNWFMQVLLDRKDRMSMVHGLEVRVPFCDHRIAEYLYNVPWEWKDLYGREKGLLRKAMEGILPDEVLWRKKSPYPKTHHPAYLKALSKKLQEVISDPSSPLLLLVKKESLEKLLTHWEAVPWYGQLMTTPQTIAYMLQLNYWMSRYHVNLI